jgi:hypothetical protein
MHKTGKLSKTTFSDEITSLERSRTKFTEILCPLTKNELVSKNCNNCKYIQKIYAKHNSGRSLTTIICLFGINEEGD